MRHANHDSKALWKPGELHPNAKLKESDVVEIRRLYATGSFSQRAIAERFGIGQAQVGKIVRGHGWTHVKEA